MFRRWRGIRSKSETMGDLVVQIPQGKLQGKKDKSIFGTEFYCFHRIPYAKPPVGELRFKAPQPADEWEGIRDATQEGAVCPTLDWQKINYLPECDEDSLFLNIYIKQPPNVGKKYPVMAWIHGGGFEFGSGNRTMCGPDYIMLHDVILVTFNYRLGALGFLSLQTPECPGNYGLKDQQLALKWIKNNIEFFGGDADNVTLFGVSAGGASVQYQTLSAQSQGLFKRAIAQSGSSLNRWGYSRTPRENAFLLGKRLGCDTNDDKVLLDFLRKTPAEDIVLKSQKIINETEGESLGESFLNFSFVPTTEPDHDGAFISEHPWVLLEKGKMLDIPYITGICEKEMVMGAIERKEGAFNKDEDFQAFIPRDITIKKNTERAIAIAKQIRNFYCKNGVTESSFIDVLSDTFFNYGVYKTVKSRTTSKAIKSPTYLYLFSYEGKQPFLKQMMGLTHIKGASHGEDTNFLFKTEFINTLEMKPGTADYDVMMNMTTLWMNFARDGVPNLKEPKVLWKQVDCQDLNYLEINKNLEMKKGLIKERMEFWDEIYSSFYNQKFAIK